MSISSLSSKSMNTIITVKCNNDSSGQQKQKSEFQQQLQQAEQEQLGNPNQTSFFQENIVKNTSSYSNSNENKINSIYSTQRYSTGYLIDRYV